MFGKNGCNKITEITLTQSVIEKNSILTVSYLLEFKFPQLQMDYRDKCG